MPPDAAQWIGSCLRMEEDMSIGKSEHSWMQEQIDKLQDDLEACKRDRDEWMQGALLLEQDRDDMVRERDEARDELEAFKVAADTYQQNAIAELDACKRERDEARAAIKTMSVNEGQLHARIARLETEALDLCEAAAEFVILCDESEEAGEWSQSTDDAREALRALLAKQGGGS